MVDGISEAASLSTEKAFELCKRYREEHKVRMFSQCWGCIKFSKSEPERMCFYKPPANDGCRFVTELAQSQRQKL